MKNKVRSCFNGQRKNAHCRGIGFSFTFDEWCVWWFDQLGPNWFEKRGCKKGQYVMARLGDRGNYKPSNVKCILHTENTREAMNNVGATNPRACLTEHDAKTIKYSSKSNTVLAREFKILPNTVAQIKRGYRWKYL